MTTKNASIDDSHPPKSTPFATTQRELAASWKTRTSGLPSAATVASPWINAQGAPTSAVYEHCVPREFAAHNLFPAVREGAIALFADLGIPWHCGIDGGPGNNLLSSQVQCVNALFAMVTDPARIKAAFGNLVDIAEVLEIEEDRFLTFEYIGPDNFFGEGVHGTRQRGANCTSLDAAFRYRTASGSTELALVEWKYIESYSRRRKPDPAKDLTRVLRYGTALTDSKGPVRADVLPFHLLLDEPLYQLVRQQLLANELEKSHAEGADVVRVLHVLDPANLAYQDSLVRPETTVLGATVDEVWQRLLRASDRFVHVDPSVFLDTAITSDEYVDRYRQRC
jgi:hypothetical protein